jgi:hypothetical protein
VTIKRPSWLSILHETGKRICLLFLEFLYANCQGRKTKLEEEEIRQNPNKMAGRTSRKKALKWEKKQKLSKVTGLTCIFSLLFSDSENCYYAP